MTSRERVLAALAHRWTDRVPRFAEQQLVAQLAFTDRLIDQLVHRLYGLTPQEIAMVEGNL